MKTIEQELKALPRVQLGRWADVKIKLRLYPIMIKNKLVYAFHWELVVPRVAQMSGAFVIAGAVAMGTLSPYAYASDHVVRGHALYPLKRGVEGIELMAAVNPDRKMNTYAKHSERRIQEAKFLSERADCHDDDCFDDDFNKTMSEAHETLRKTKSISSLNTNDQKAVVDVDEGSEKELVLISDLLEDSEHEDSKENARRSIELIRELRGEQEDDNDDEYIKGAATERTKEYTENKEDGDRDVQRVYESTSVVSSDKDNEGETKGTKSRKKTFKQWTSRMIDRWEDKEENDEHRDLGPIREVDEEEKERDEDHSGEAVNDEEKSEPEGGEREID